MSSMSAHSPKHPPGRKTEEKKGTWGDHSSNKFSVIEQWTKHQLFVWDTGTFKEVRSQVLLDCIRFPSGWAWLVVPW